MKTLLMVFLSIAVATTLHAQISKFTGDWKGQVFKKDGSSLWVRIKITEDNISQYFWDSDNNRWSIVSPSTARYSYNKNNLIFYWLNDGGVWTETQTFMLSYVNDGKLYIVWSRQVDNNKEYDRQ